MTSSFSSAGPAQAAPGYPIGTLRATFEDPGATPGDPAFGYSVAKSGSGKDSTVVVGAPIVNAAYIYAKDTWPTTPTATLNDPGTSVNDDFGNSVAVSGTTAVVGAPNSAEYAGAAYIYVKGTSGWPSTPTATLNDPAATSGDGFSNSVAISGTTAVVGAPDTNTPAGAAYIYEEGASAWPTSPTVTLADPLNGAAFGISVAVLCVPSRGWRRCNQQRRRVGVHLQVGPRLMSN